MEAKKESLERARRDLDVRIGEKRENIGDALSNDSDQVLEEKLREFDQNYQKLVSVVSVWYAVVVVMRMEVGWSVVGEGVI